MLLKNKINFSSNVDSYWQSTQWIPASNKLTEWFKKASYSLKKNNDGINSWDPTIVSFYNFIQKNSSICFGVKQMIKDAINTHGMDTPIQSIKQMCGLLNLIITMTPKYSSNGGELVGVPVAALFADVACNENGLNMFVNKEFNAHLKKILNKWMNYLDDPSSFTIANNGEWLSKSAKDDYNFKHFKTELNQAPYWTCWNNFFTRDYKPGIRPNFGENDHNIIQLANDGTYCQHRLNIKKTDKFWLKDMQYSLSEIFDVKYSKYANRFIGGSIFQSYLNPFNYHNYHSPVDGVVVESGIIDGTYFPQLAWKYGISDPGAGILSLPWLLHVNARGIFIIDTKNNANIGFVCMVAIGMGEVSSINFIPKIGDKVRKGQKIGFFKYGGSSIAIITENMSRYNKELKYDDTFGADPNAHVEFFVGEIMANICKKL